MTMRFFPSVCAAIVAALMALPQKAQSAVLTVNGTKIQIDVPSGYTDVTAEADGPPFIAVFETTPVEEWEEIGEFNEEIVSLVYEFGSKDPDVIAERFDALFTSLFTYSIATNAGQPFNLDTALVSEGVFDTLTRFSSLDSPGALVITESTADRKALMIEASLALPGVTTYPYLEEISLTLAEDFLVVSRIRRVELEGDIASEVRATGARLRQGIAKISASD